MAPFRPGESPFHIKGATYIAVTEGIARIPGGMEAVAAQLPDDDHRAFLRKVFLAVSWYDALPLATITRAMAAVEGKPFAESVRARAIGVAQRDLSGLYSLLLKVASPEFVIERLQRVSLRYFDFGRTEIIEQKRKLSVCRITGFPAPIADWFMAMISGYASEALRRAGAGSPRVELGQPVVDGSVHGVDTVTITLRFSWD